MLLASPKRFVHPLGLTRPWHGACARKKWAQEALGHDALLTAWSGLLRLASGLA